MTAWSCKIFHYCIVYFYICTDLPCELAVWWEKHSQLIIYPVKEGGKLPTLPPTKRIHQTSVIMCSSISADTSMLALGLKNGVLAVWNMKTSEII